MCVGVRPLFVRWCGCVGVLKLESADFVDASFLLVNQSHPLILLLFHHPKPWPPPHPTSTTHSYPQPRAKIIRLVRIAS